MDTLEIIRSQYHASLEMLGQAIEKCPESLWADSEDKNKFWHVAYHAIFYTHLYLQTTEDDFSPWEKHKDNYQYMGALPYPPHDEPVIGEPYRKEEVLQYLEFCREQIDEKVPVLNFTDESGFSWISFGKLELQFYNIRHLQHHTGELCERLGTRANIDVNWIGMKHDDQT